MMTYPERRQPFESLTSIDERVDYLRKQLIALQSGMNQLLEKEGMPTLEMVTKQVSLRATVAPATGADVTGASPLTGKITQIVPHWPSGCNALVDIAFGHTAIWTMPDLTDTYLALDAATPVFITSEPVFNGEELWMRVRNGDGVNPHTVSVVVTIVGAE